MAILCTPDDLADSIACLGNQDKQTLLAQIVYLLCQLNSMSCDPDTLADIDEVKCLQNWDEQSLLAAAVYQLCQISGGGGLGGCNSVDSGSPEGVVTANPGCIYLDDLTDSFWLKKSGVGSVGWLQLIV